MISTNVVILTTEELAEIKRKEFLRGVERGKFEAHSQAQGSAGHSGATENTGSASGDVAVRPANSEARKARRAVHRFLAALD